MEIVYSMVMILTGGGLLYFGLKKYNTSLAISIFIPGLYGLVITKLIEIYPEYSLGGLIGITLITLFLARPITYLMAWTLVLGTLIYLIQIAGIYESVRGPFAIVLLIIAAVVVWFIRTHLRALIIGFIGGLSLGLGTLSFVLGILLSGNSNDFLIRIFTGGTTPESVSQSAFLVTILPMLWILACTIGGIVFQYLYIIPRQNLTSTETPSKEDVIKNDDSDPKDQSSKSEETPTKIDDKESYDPDPKDQSSKSDKEKT